MSSKLRLSDIAISEDDLLDEFILGNDSPRLKQKPKTRTEKRHMIDNYMEARALKRNISDGFDLH